MHKLKTIVSDCVICIRQLRRLSQGSSLQTMLHQSLEEVGRKGIYISLYVLYLCVLTHCSLETPKRVIDKQCRPRSDQFNHFSLGISKSHGLTYIKSKLESSKCGGVHSVCNGLIIHLVSSILTIYILEVFFRIK